MNDLIRIRTDLSREKVRELIEEKKKKVGGGYLTDQGALFLVASDLGVVLNYKQVNRSKLADLRSNENDVTVSVRILAIAPPKTFTRKSDSNQGLLCRMLVYDESAILPLNLWDSKAAAVFNNFDLTPSGLVKISNAYVRQSVDGSNVLNLGERGKLEKLENSDESSMIPALDQMVVLPDAISPGSKSLVVSGKVDGEVRKSSFSRKDGTVGNLITFALKNPNSGNSAVRVVVWETANPVFMNLRNDESVTLLNLRSKVGNGPNGTVLELHGDETTTVLEYWEETKHWMKKSIQTVDGLGAYTREVKQAKPVGVVPFVVRVLSIGWSGTDERSGHLLIIDSQKRKISVSLLRESSEGLASLGIDDVLVCRPDTIDYIALKATCTKKGSVTKVSAKRQDIPTSATLLARIENLEPNSIASVEVMSLSESIGREIQTKDGLVKRCELLVGDPTGEIKVYGWRNLSKLLERIPAGVRLFLRAVEVQSHEGKAFLVLKNYSRVERKD